MGSAQAGQVRSEPLNACTTTSGKLLFCGNSVLSTQPSAETVTMGYTLPSPNSPTERARELMTRKDAIEAELEAQGSILKANNTDMRQPLVDREGFPRADLDVWAVRHARVRIIELRNDLAALMDEIAKTLETIYARSPTPPVEGRGDDATSVIGTEAASPGLLPFARVNGVAPSSPAADAVRDCVYSAR